MAVNCCGELLGTAQRSCLGKSSLCRLVPWRPSSPTVPAPAFLPCILSSISFIQHVGSAGSLDPPAEPRLSDTQLFVHMSCIHADLVPWCQTKTHAPTSLGASKKIASTCRLRVNSAWRFSCEVRGAAQMARRFLTPLTSTVSFSMRVAYGEISVSRTALAFAWRAERKKKLPRGDSPSSDA